ncbi:fumarylacetoacetate hydrolase family protein [Flavobacteriales bacterium]|jgi:2-keto-4-pentenoate hydratase/2-oxohepta-3-ene-1,7-dioic acid hydratase in catechol pathway|nr:fumarylacetoacetate hydrolase family protein [Flavobacteriales bacterium]
MKIVCIGRNYADHAAELGNAVPAEPLFFFKPESAILHKDHPFAVPEWTEDCHYEVELVVRMDRAAKWIEEGHASRCYTQVGLGIDFTARDVQQKLKAAGKPWEKAKAFDGSAVLSKAWVPLADLGGDVQDIRFSLLKNGAVVQEGHTADMLFPVDALIAHVSKYSTWKTGDLLFTGTPAGVGPVQSGDHLEGRLGGRTMFALDVL